MPSSKLGNIRNGDISRGILVVVQKGFTIGIRACVVIIARWARHWLVLSCAMGLLGAVRRFARALGNFVSRLIAATTPNLGIWLL